MGHEFQQRRHREFGRAHEDQAKGHEMEKSRGPLSLFVMAGPVPAIHVLGAATKHVDARIKPGHDDG
jgi:hypothetical protein